MTIYGNGYDSRTYLKFVDEYEDETFVIHDKGDLDGWPLDRRKHL